MTYAKFKLALGVVLTVLLAGAVAILAISCRKAADNLQPSNNLQASDNLQPGEIFKKAQEKYASLNSYSDEGKTVAILNGTTITTTFTIRLARPNFYRIEWEQNTESADGSAKTKRSTVWSAGEGDFLDMAGRGAEKQASQETALAGATGISASASATIPGTFFKMNWGNQLGNWAADQKEPTEEKVGDVNCYVFTRDLNGIANTLWIGKQDFLIHQVRHVTSAKAMKAYMDEAAKRNPGLVLPAQKFDGVTSTETHTNIIVNPKFSQSDFNP
jgi:hypothetical protein